MRFFFHSRWCWKIRIYKKNSLSLFFTFRWAFFFLSPTSVQTLTHSTWNVARERERELSAGRCRKKRRWQLRYYKVISFWFRIPTLYLYALPLCVVVIEKKNENYYGKAFGFWNKINQSATTASANYQSAFFFFFWLPLMLRIIIICYYLYSIMIIYPTF